MKKTTYAIILFHAALGALVYSNVFNAPFVFDDELYIVNNPAIRSISGLLTWPRPRALVFLSFAANYAVSGLDVFGFHLVNIGIHVTNAVLVFLLARLTFESTAMKSGTMKHSFWIAASASVLFMVHPLNTQAITYTTQRFTSLAALLYLSAIVLYAKHRLSVSNGAARFYYCLSLTSAILAQFAKETAFTLPAMLALYEFAFFSSSKAYGLKDRAMKLTPFLSVFIITPVLLMLPDYDTITIAGKLARSQLADLEGLSWYAYLITQFKVIVIYMRLLVWPAGQSLLHEVARPSSFFEPLVLSSFLFLTSIFIGGASLVVHARKKGSAAMLIVGFGILWFFIAISVESSIIPIKDVIFEHRVYLPGIGALAAFAACIFQLSTTLSVRYNLRWLGAREAIAVICVISAMLAITAYKRNALWADRIALWQDVVNKAPNTADAYVNLGYAYKDAGRVDMALDNYGKAIRIEPQNPTALNNIAGILIDLGRHEESLEYSLRIRPEHYELVNAYMNIGTAYGALGNHALALFNLEKSLTLQPESAMAHFNLAVAYHGSGSFEAALKHYAETVRINPLFADAYNNAGLVLAALNRTDEAFWHFETALKVDPANRYASINIERLRSGLTFFLDKKKVSKEKSVKGRRSLDTK
ncbi:MAG: tetratricopeptide repeat protein [Deltaproteobacteria bacterium]|nr:tetratricopeptide repeat protein [Deltaproteobacteria bacterium]